MKLVPYLNFPGNTEEAMNFYQKALDGTLHDVGRFGDRNPDMPEDQKNRIMHARLSFGDNMLMFSDGMPGRPIREGDNISLSIGLDDEEKARAVFGALSEGGKVTMPMEKQFWGALFGMLIDRFGIQWMINCEL